MDKKMHDKGLEVRKAVLGEAYVNNALKNVDDFNRPFQEMLNEYCWARCGAARSCRARPAAC
jgi:4-carboxymuconolactone decarboxylase